MTNLFSKWFSMIIFSYLKHRHICVLDNDIVCTDTSKNNLKVGLNKASAWVSNDIANIHVEIISPDHSRRHYVPRALPRETIQSFQSGGPCACRYNKTVELLKLEWKLAFYPPSIPLNSLVFLASRSILTLLSFWSKLPTCKLPQLYFIQLWCYH